MHLFNKLGALRPSNTLASLIFKTILVVGVSLAGVLHARAELVQSCADASTEYIIGGQSLQNDKSAVQINSKCFISAVTDAARLKKSKAFKFDKSVKLDRDVNNVAIKVNLYDKKTVEDRNFILNAELRKAILLKEELSKNKSNGKSVDELQLSRIDADITALKNELSR